MKKYAAVLALAAVLFIFASLLSAFANDIAWDEIGRGNLNLKAVLVNPDNPGVIYIGSSNGVFKSEDAGSSYRNILSVRGNNRKVNFLVFAADNKDSLYAATANGLYFSANAGKNWDRIFRGKSYFENECTVLAVMPLAIYLGTKAGLFISRDNGRSWHKQAGKLGSSGVMAIAWDKSRADYVYVACVDGVFKSKDAGRSWERIFVSNPAENGQKSEETVDDNDEAERFSGIRYIAVDSVNGKNLYLATSAGIYKSRDEGMTWELLSDYGLLSKDVRFLLLSDKSAIYAVTKSGVFTYQGERWQELSLGLAAEEINFLSSDNQNNLYAACDKGLFKANIKYSGSANQEGMAAAYYKDEPAISEVQRIAIKYAEVDPEKIARWRKQAAKRALLPKVTIDMDRDMDRTTSNSIWGTYSSNGTPGRYFVGPDDVTKYNNKNLGVSLTWELGDLIFSDDQTNIDVRSRLMVQLRDDILDEVTKAYFERLRVKMELDVLSIIDTKKRAEKELRLQELTAMLDGLTGGYFSSQIKKKF